MYNIECTNVICNNDNYLFRPPGPSSGCAEDFKLNYTLVAALVCSGGGRGREGGGGTRSRLYYHIYY
jgi:hypothetical protein